MSNKSLSLKELIDRVQSDCNKDISLELLCLYFKGDIINKSMISGLLDPDLYSNLTIIFIKTCTLYKSS